MPKNSLSRNFATRWQAICFGLLCCIGLNAPLLAQPLVRGLPDFTELVEQQSPVVVNISTSQQARGNRPITPNTPPNSPFAPDDPAFELFRRFFPPMPGQGGGNVQPREPERKSLGSGFIISADGYILTNAHVVDAAEEIRVRLTDKREFRARAIGADKRTDVALIKIEATGLPVARLGDPAQLKVGEWVIAIGSPFGFESSVTAGIVSAKGRSLPRENYVPFIQTDVAINPGNSGGPLFNMRGEVVGINSQIYSRSGGYMGLSFAIPIDVAMEIQRQLRTQGKVSRGRLGAVVQDLTPELATSLGLQKAQGALVSGMDEGGPAEKAGLEVGDVVLKFDGKPVVTANDLPRMVGLTRPGSRVSLQVWRRGATRELSVTVGEMPDENLARRGDGNLSRTPDLAASRLGLVLRELTPEERRSRGLMGALLVKEVNPPASRNDIRPGDLIVALMRVGGLVEVRSMEDINMLLSRLDRNANVTLLIRRGEGQTFVTIRGNPAAAPAAPGVPPGNGAGK